MAVEFDSGARQHTQKMKTAQTPRSRKAEYWITMCQIESISGNGMLTHLNHG